MRPVVALLLLSGCLSEHEQLLRSWQAVYEVERVTQNTADCDSEGAQTPLEPAWMEIVTEAGVDADLVDLRPCSSTEECDRVGFFTFIATRASDTVLSGGIHQSYYTFGDNGQGLCSVQYDDVLVTRPSKGARDLRVEIRTSTATDATVLNEQACDELLEIMLEDPNGCDALRTYEGRRVGG